MDFTVDGLKALNEKDAEIAKLRQYIIKLLQEKQRLEKQVEDKNGGSGTNNS